MRSAKRWNNVRGSTDHMWGNRFYANLINSERKFDFAMNYIDLNPVAAGLAANPAEWKTSGAYYKAHNIKGLLDHPI